MRPVFEPCGKLDSRSGPERADDRAARHDSTHRRRGRPAKAGGPPPGAPARTRNRAARAATKPGTSGRAPRDAASGTYRGKRPRVHTRHEEPVIRNRRIAFSPTSVRSRSLVPGPSASNGAPSFHRPLMALPRSTTAVLSGMAARTTSTNASKRDASPPNAHLTTWSRFSSSVRSPGARSGRRTCRGCFKAFRFFGGPGRAASSRRLKRWSQRPRHRHSDRPVHPSAAAGPLMAASRIGSIRRSRRRLPGLAALPRRCRLLIWRVGGNRARANPHR